MSKETIGYWLVIPQNREHHPFPLNNDEYLTPQEAYISGTIHNRGKPVRNVIWIPDQYISDWVKPKKKKKRR